VALALVHVRARGGMPAEAVAPREISKKKPMMAPSIQLFTNTASRLPGTTRRSCRRSRR